MQIILSEEEYNQLKFSNNEEILRLQKENRRLDKQVHELKEKIRQCYGEVDEVHMINGQDSVYIIVRDNPVKVRFTLEHGETSMIINHSGTYSLTCYGDYYCCSRMN